MKRILVLHDEELVRKRLYRIMVARSYQVAVCASIEELDKRNDKYSFDLYLCGQLGKYSDGLISALDLHDLGKKVVIVGEKAKFSKFPLLRIKGVHDKQIKNAIEQHLAGG